MQVKKLTKIMKKLLTLLLISPLLAGCFWEKSTPIHQEFLSLGESKFVEIGGIKQWVEVKGDNGENPVMIWLNNGPGVSETPWMWFWNENLTSDFTMVMWDQRGTGRSWNEEMDVEDINLDQLMEDTNELMDIVTRSFGKEKVFLVGHGWGTLLGVKVTEAWPEKVTAWVGIGQITDSARGEKAGWEWALMRAIEDQNRDAASDLEEMGEPEDGKWAGEIDSLIQERRWLADLGGGSGKELWLRDEKERLWNEWFRSGEKGSVKKGEVASMSQLWEEVADVNLFKEVKKLSVPVVLMSGRFDLVADRLLAKEWLDSLEAPKKMFIWFENSAHDPHLMESVKWQRMMVEKVRGME